MTARTPMPLFRWILAAAVVAPALQPAPAAAQSAVVTTPQVRAELVAHAPQGVGAGKPLALGLWLEHQPKWHTYWKNPGDSGLPTTLTWQLPPGVSAGDIEWPTPRKLPLGPLLNFGYEGTLLLPVQVTVPADLAGDTLDIKLRAEWLVCKDVCIPESGDFALRLPIQAATALHGPRFEASARARPTPLPQADARAELKDGALVVSVGGLPADWRGGAVDFFPETPGVIHNGAKPATRWDGERWMATVPLDPMRSASPDLIPAVLTLPGREAGVEVAVQVTGPWPAAGPGPAALAPVTPSPMPDLPTASAAGSGSALSLGLALAFAVLGGMILNLMPCVFPVLSLKVMGFARHADDRRTLLAGGLAYTAGVILSFVALAALMLALRAGGEQIGWGFQLQSPAVIATLAALFTVIGLNLTGLFEFGSLLPDRLATARMRHPLVDSALTGVLAVAIAAPCTAPFMGASLGLAVTLPATEALAIFAALGLGMALPYLAASAWPGLARALPRPGAWMVTFRGLMAFPMFATVVWLVWVLGQQAGIDGAAALLGALVALAFVIWALGTAGIGRSARRGLAGFALLLLAGTLTWALPALRAQPVLAADASATWQPWSAQRIADATAEGRPAFVDFTAAWCVTCQLNKRTTLNDERVQADFQAKRVLLLRADWTRRDDAITAELTRLGRTGVPVYALYTPGVTQPRLLGEILSVGEVRDALAALP